MIIYVIAEWDWKETSNGFSKGSKENILSKGKGREEKAELKAINYEKVPTTTTNTWDSFLFRYFIGLTFAFMLN